MNKLSLNSIINTCHEPEVKVDMCSCSNCGWKGKVSDCESEWESDGWEYPEYLIELCPKCEDGGLIEDYWYSPKMLKEYYKSKETKK